MSRTNVHPANARSLRAAAVRLRRGELVAFPTETVYGLGANALDERAVAKIFEAKGRPRDNPMIVHVSDMKMLRKVAKAPPPRAKALLARFWPGPLTLVLSRKSSVPPLVTAGLDTVAVRMPQGLARDLVRLAGVPIAAPSANLSGRPSPTTAAHVAEDFPDVFVLDGGPTKHGVESTVVALEPRPVVLRQGAVTEESLRKMIPGLGRAASSGHLAPGRGASSSRNAGIPRMTDVKGPRPLRGARSAPLTSSQPARSPGTKYKHYAPSRPLILFRRKKDLAAYFASHPQSLVLCPASLSPLFPKQRFLSLGSSSAEIARALFAALRTRRKGTELLALAIPRRGIGRAVMDRLTRAATRIVP
jgi:L-threonylcarbamoyladenylate synthase